MITGEQIKQLINYIAYTYEDGEASFVRIAQVNREDVGLYSVTAAESPWTVQDIDTIMSISGSFFVNSFDEHEPRDAEDNFSFVLINWG